MIKEGVSKKVAFQRDLSGERSQPRKSTDGNVLGRRDRKCRYEAGMTGVMKEQQKASVTESE